MKTPSAPPWARRDFLRLALVGSAGALLADPGTGRAAPANLRAAVIGHTGRGDFGHDLDLVFAGREGIELVALADPDAAGRAKTAARIGAPKAYADYREMLEKEKPDLVSIAMRQADQHHAIALACLRAGAHIYCEKPFTTCPAESDEVLAEASRRRLRIAVAHNMRMMPAASALHQAVANGRLGQVAEMRAYGKQDHRAGGEDMMVLGTHLFDLMRLLAGNPESCSARVLHDGRNITLEHARSVKDNVGLVAGNHVFATFGFSGAMTATFTSAPKLRETIGHWGLEILGSKGVARINCDLEPAVFLRQTTGWSKKGRQDDWQRLDHSGIPTPPTPQFNAVSDWLESIAHDREPFCSGTNGAWAVEMAMAVYESALTAQRVRFPLARRTHPLAPH